MAFAAIMFVLLIFFTEFGTWTAVAFLIGAVVSILCGIFGMVIATRTNYRVTFCAVQELAPAFRTAYRAGCAIGFALVSFGLLGIFFFTQSSPSSSSSTKSFVLLTTVILIRSITTLYSSRLPVTVWEALSLLCSVESEEVSTPRLLM